jgi:hypothetical protein
MKTALQSVEARFVLGLVLSDELPGIAADLIASGLESKSLIRLAGLAVTEVGDARELFEQALEELSRGRMSKELALRRFTQDTCEQILQNSLSPFEGAKLIWQTYRASDVLDTHDYDPFIYAASEMEDRPKDRNRFEIAILEEAKRWVGGQV